VSDRPKPTIGLTGGIASGKSTVARILADLGAAVIDADALAREVVKKGSDGLRELVATFGQMVLAADGGLDREALAAVVFRDPEARRKLNAITHPRIGMLSAQRIAEAQATAAPYVVYEAALLVETGAHKGMAALVVVAADAATQARRTVARDGMSQEAAQARIAAQLPLSDKIAVADYVIHNDGQLDALRAATLEVHEQIMRRFGLSQAQE
jgi:dephospho-CoA kinase